MVAAVTTLNRLREKMVKCQITTECLARFTKPQQPTLPLVFVAAKGQNGFVARRGARLPSRRSTSSDDDSSNLFLPDSSCVYDDAST